MENKILVLTVLYMSLDIFPVEKYPSTAEPQTPSPALGYFSLSREIEPSKKLLHRAWKLCCITRPLCMRR